jgi:hypothetical protein
MIIGASAAVVFGGVAGGMAVVVNTKWERSEKKIGEDPWGIDANAIAYNIRVMQIISWVSLGLSGVGLVLTAVAIPLTDWGGRWRDDSAAVSVTPFGGPFGGGLALSGRF